MLQDNTMKILVPWKSDVPFKYCIYVAFQVSTRVIHIIGQKQMFASKLLPVVLKILLLVSQLYNMVTTDKYI